MAPFSRIATARITEIGRTGGRPLRRGGWCHDLVPAATVAGWGRDLSAPFREERKSPVVATVEQLAALVRGRLVGDGTVPIRSARPVSEAGPGDITFIENERYVKYLRTSPASAAIVGPHFNRHSPAVKEDLTVIEVEDPIA